LLKKKILLGACLKKKIFFSSYLPSKSENIKKSVFLFFQLMKILAYYINCIFKD